MVTVSDDANDEIIIGLLCAITVRPKNLFKNPDMTFINLE